MCGAWGYLVWSGSIATIWPTLGIANQLLACIALTAGTTMLMNRGKARYAWVTILPLTWLGTVTVTAGLQKIFSSDVRLGFLAQARATADAAPTAISSRLIFNDRLDAVVAGFFIASFIVVLVSSIHEWWMVISGRRPAVSTETPYVPRASFPTAAA